MTDHAAGQAPPQGDVPMRDAITEPPVTRTALLAASAAGLVAAIVVPENELGLGLTLTAVTAVSVLLALRPIRSWLTPWRGAVLGCAVSMMTLPAISDAAWVVALALLVAVAATVVALGGGRSWPGVVLPSFRCVPLGFRTLAAIGRTISQLAPGGARSRQILLAMVLTVGLLGVFGALFASADRLFGTFVERFLVPDLSVDLAVARFVVFAIVAAGILTLVRLHPRPADDGPRPATRSLQGVAWQVPLTGLVALFAAFVSIQFGVLFGGHERVLRTAGLTYAEYARGGFAQLVVVAILTLAVIAVASRYATPRSGREDRQRRWLLAGLCLLTLVVLASAFHRLSLYQEAFGFTRLRFGAQAVIWWLAVVFVLVLLAGGLRRAGMLPRILVLVTAGAVVAVGYLQPDAFVARWNVERYAAEATIDVDYLAGLSDDAIPALTELPAEVRVCVLDARGYRLHQGDQAGWAAWNRSRARAASVLDDQPRATACRRPPG